MCGLVGQVSFNNQIEKDIIIGLGDSINHRGPDDKGTYESQTKICFLGHRRLSIIDLSENARQPMICEDGRFSIVFNGEIYNYVELKNDLSKSGEKFKSSSDTEVLLKLYIKYGIKCLDLLRGMFIFAIWDNLKNELFLARDPLGIKQVFYIETIDGIIFSSELRALNKMKLCKKLDYSSIATFLRRGSIQSPNTIFENVKSLDAGSFLMVSKNDKIKKTKYWDMGFLEFGKIKFQNQNDVVSYVRESLLDSVKSHLVSDVPVGAFLSGGIDSSAIVSLMRQCGQNKIGTFSLSFEDGMLNESVYSRQVSEFYDTDHHELVISKDDITNIINDFNMSMDQPTIDGLNTYIVSKFAQQNGYKVVTSGIGGDELFRGYSLFKILPKIDSIFKNSPTFCNRLLSYFLQKSGSLNSINPKWQRFSSAIYPNYSFVNLYEQSRALFSNFELENILNEYNESFDKNKDSILKEFFEIETSIEYKISLMESYRYLGSQLLYDSDIFSMANSVELRTPLVDKILYEKIYSIKNEYWLNNKNYNKSLLIDAVGDLPMSIYDRKKMGFVLPLEQVLKNQIYELKSEVINDEYFNEIEKSFAHGRVHYSKIWAIRVLDQYIANIQS